MEKYRVASMSDDRAARMTQVGIGRRRRRRRELDTHGGRRHL